MKQTLGWTLATAMAAMALVAVVASGTETTAGAATAPAIAGSGAAVVLPELAADLAKGGVAVTSDMQTAEAGNAYTGTRAMVTRVISVTLGSPAAVAGVMPGDTITEVDNVALRSPADLVRAVQGMKPGEGLMLGLQRGTEMLVSKITLGSHPDKPGVAYVGISLGGRFAGKAGARPGGLRPQPPAAGVRILDVLVDGPAAKAGVMRGDLVRMIDGKALADTRALREVLAAQKPGSSIKLALVRAGQPLELNVTMAEHPDNKGAGYLGVRLAPEGLTPQRQR